MGFRPLGEAVRISDKASIHNCELIEIGDNTRIDDFVVLSGCIEIGCNVHIAVFCNVAGGSEGVFLSDFSGRAYGCQVLSQSDDYSGRTMTNPTVPTRFKRETKLAARVGRHCIVGACSVIFPGVNLAEGCAVGLTARSSTSSTNCRATAWKCMSPTPRPTRKRRCMSTARDAGALRRFAAG